MTRLRSIDYDAGMALFETADRYVVVDINKRDVVETSENLESITASAGWLKVGPTLEYPDVWRELADAATTTLDVQETEVAPAERTFQIPKAVKVEAQQALDWVSGFDRGKSFIGAAFAEKLLTQQHLTASDIARLDRYFSRISKRSLSAGWAPGQQGYPTNERIRFAMRGGEAGQAWVSKIVARHGLTAAGEVDGNKPHEFKDDPDIPGSCIICGRPADAPVHVGVVAGAFEYDDTCEYFGRGVNPDETLVNALLMLRTDGTWHIREDGVWNPTQEPAEDEVIIMLDEESAYKLAEILDDIVPKDPNVLPFELTTINPHEAALAALALEESDEWAFVDRVMEMFDIYDSTERSVNAKKQNRAAGGRFGEKPDAPAQAEGNQQGQVKARLPQPLPLVPDVAARIAEYIAQNGAPTDAPDAGNERETSTLDAAYLNSIIDTYGDTEFGRQELDALEFNWVEDVGGLPHYIKRIAKHLREKGMTEGHAIASAVNAAEKMCATGDLNFPGKQDVNPGSKAEACKAVAEWNEKKARAKADNALWQFADVASEVAADPAAARPLYLAIVDKVDTEAVLDLVSLMPGNPPVMWKRDGGTWVQAPDLLAAMQGTQPPPVVELKDDAIVQDVIKQVDEATSGATEEPDTAPTPGATEQAPNGATGPKPDANPDQQRRAASTREFALFGPHGQLLNLTEFAGGADRNRGHAEELRKYWTRGKGGLKIRWNTPGDMTRCMRHLRKYLMGREAGYCALRHREMTGRWPGERDKNGNL